jgi:phospholipid transport system substrate-binding protein
VVSRPSVFGVLVAGIAISLCSTIAAAQATIAAVQPTCDRLVADANTLIVTVVREQFETLQSNMTERYRLIDDLVKPYFDFDYGSSVLLEDYWTDADHELRNRFTGAFYGYLVANYGNLVIDYVEDTLQVTGACTPWIVDDEEIYFLQAILTLNDGTEVDLYIFMHEVDGQQKIWDIQADGISQVAHFRSQFSEQLEDEGLLPLVLWLEEEAAAQRQE